MSERETSKRPPEAGEPAEEIEIIDVTDLLEDDSDAPEKNATPDSGDGRSEVLWDDADNEEAMDDDDLLHILKDDEDDEEIIDLVDVVDGRAGVAAGRDDELTGAAVEENGSAAAGAWEPGIDNDLEDDFIAAFDLEEILGGAPHALDGVDLEKTAAESDSDGDFIDALDLDLAPDLDQAALSVEEEETDHADFPPGPPVAADAPGGAKEAGAPVAPAGIHLTEQQVDAAVERVIRKMAAEKIDAILVEAIEKTVNEEIGRLKDLLNLGSPDL